MLLASRLRDTNDVIAAESFLPLRGRVAVTLLDLAEHFGQSVGGDRIMIRHKFRQPDLAAMAGIAARKPQPHPCGLEAPQAG